MILAWDAVLTDILCQPEAAIVYEVAVGRVSAQLWTNDNPQPNIVQSPVVVGIQAETTFQTAAEPAVGECVMVQVTAIDAAGNRDTGEVCE